MSNQISSGGRSRKSGKCSLVNRPLNSFLLRSHNSSPMKRAPSNSAANVVKAMVNASKPDLVPPAHTPLREEALRFWTGIVRARAREEWIEVDLVVAAQLARCQADIERESAALEGEGSVKQNQRGTSSCLCGGVLRQQEPIRPRHRLRTFLFASAIRKTTLINASAPGQHQDAGACDSTVTGTAPRRRIG